MLNFPRWKIILISLLCLFGILFAMPNFVSQQTLDNFPGWLPTQKIALGLDLQGGSHMLLEVDVGALVEERLENLQDDVRTVLRRDRIRYTGLSASEKSVTFRLSDQANEARAIELLEALAQPITNSLFALPGSSSSLDIEVEAEGDGRISVILTDEGILARRTSAVQQSIEIVRRRVDEMGTREPSIQRQGTDRILVQVPGLQDPQQLRDMLGTTAKLTFHLVDVTVSADDILRGRAPPGTIILPMVDNPAALVAIRRRAMVSGENLIDAQPSFNQNGLPAVTIRFDITGSRQFGRATAENVGRPFAIVLDDEVISAPVINEPIPGGRAIISGGFTVQGANDLAILLRAGALPAPLTILEERSVGPDLGADSVAAGKNAAIIGLLAVVVFIILTYGRFGVAANLALMINIALLMAALSILGATLTLPGIAGIVLTIGMAVDANVLVFERIREETRAGRAPLAAVDMGYTQALSTILDANITTLIAALILFQFGAGPIKGFAVTLAIGIITSVFTAVTVTRLIITIWLRRTRPETLTL